MKLQQLNVQLVAEKEAALEQVCGIVQEKHASEQEVVSAFAALREEHQAKVDLQQELEEVRETVSRSSSADHILMAEEDEEDELPPFVRGDFEVAGAFGAAAFRRTVSTVNLARDISLMAELKMQVEGEAAKHLEDLQTSLSEAYEREQKIEAEASDLRKELEQQKLSQSMASSQSAMMVSQQVVELQSSHARVCEELAEERCARKKYELLLEERERDLGSECSRLKAEAAALQVELDGIRTSSKDQAEASQLQVVHLEHEVSLLRSQQQNVLREQAATTEQLQDSDRMAGEHADELAHVKHELEAIRGDLEKLSRVVTSMSTADVVTAAANGATQAEDSDNEPELTTVQLLGVVREQIRVVRAAVEVMVRRSLEKVFTTTGSGEPAANLSDEEKKEFQLQVQQLQVQLAAKRQEVSTLRTVLKAHRSTAQAAVFRERSFAERQIRAAESEMAALRERITKLRDDNVEFAKMRAVFGKR